MMLLQILKKKQRKAVEDLDEKDSEFDFNSSAEVCEWNGSSWSYNRTASMTIDLRKNKPKGGTS